MERNTMMEKTNQSEKLMSDFLDFLAEREMDDPDIKPLSVSSIRQLYFSEVDVFANLMFGTCDSAVCYSWYRRANELSTFVFGAGLITSAEVGEVTNRLRVLLDVLTDGRY